MEIASSNIQPNDQMVLEKCMAELGLERGALVFLRSRIFLRKYSREIKAGGEVRPWCRRRWFRRSRREHRRRPERFPNQGTRNFGTLKYSPKLSNFAIRLKLLRDTFQWMSPSIVPKSGDDCSTMLGLAKMTAVARRPFH